MTSDPRTIRLVHISDIHFWQYAFNPFLLFNKRLLGMASLLVRRARKFRLERVQEVVERVLSLAPDHILITGDLTTTALPVEFRAARQALDPWLRDPSRATVLPGNHDRYTHGALRKRLFEQYFGEFAPEPAYPWLRFLAPDTAILGLDPTRPALTARGRLPHRQLERSKELIAGQGSRIRRLIVACHYPVEVPRPYRQDLASKNLVNSEELGRWLAAVGPHLYCCGHVHAAWAFVPEKIPGQLCLNPGAPLLHDRTGKRPPGFFEILIEDGDVTVHQHAWLPQGWRTLALQHARGFFHPATVPAR